MTTVNFKLFMSQRAICCISINSQQVVKICCTNCLPNARIANRIFANAVFRPACAIFFKIIITKQPFCLQTLVNNQNKKKFLSTRTKKEVPTPEKKLWVLIKRFNYVLIVFRFREDIFEILKKTVGVRNKSIKNLKLKTDTKKNLTLWCSGHCGVKQTQCNRKKW